MPWLSGRFLLLFRSSVPGKPFWLCLIEWLLLYGLAGLLAFGLERKVTGNVYHQGWEFVVVTFFLFLVFTLPGFIYRYRCEFKRLLRRRP